MKPRSRSSRPLRAARSERRGAALITTLIFSTAIAALAISAIYMGGHVTVIGKTFERERDYRYAAEAALAIGKSKVNADTNAMPDSGYVTFMNNAVLTGADGVPLPRAQVNLYAGPTGSSSGQFGTYASVVAEARDANGARFVRRLELTQESFAKFAYFSEKETTPGGTLIYFCCTDQLWGPVHSNDQIRIASSRATFNDIVTTSVGSINGVANGTFRRGYMLNQPVIPLPSNAKLAKLAAYATAGQLNFNAPNAGNEDQVLMRLEFVAADISAPLDGDSTDIDEGFIKIYVANAGQAPWLRANFNTTKTLNTNCGVYFTLIRGPTPGPKFFPASVMVVGGWARDYLRDFWATGAPATWQAQADAVVDDTNIQYMARAGARCFPGGHPHLVAVERDANGLAAGFTAAQARKGGDDTTHTFVGARGRWTPWPGVVEPRLAAANAHPIDAGYMFPIYRGLNPGAKGVVRVNGTVAVSGNVRGRLTLYAENGNIVILDDFRYSSDPAVGRCVDIMGMIATLDVVVADNGILTPRDIGGGVWRFFDDTPGGVDIHAVIMALETSFRVQNYANMPDRATVCGTSNAGRGCLNLAGGIIMDRRGLVATFGSGGVTGYVKRYSYDRCAAISPPPYFPTTGKYIDNRYYEVDPSDFNAASMFNRLSPNP